MATTTPKKLAQLLAEAKAPPPGTTPEGTQDAFFKGLLDATVYAHVPSKKAPKGVMRFIQFVRPDNGQTMLPFFSEKKQAEMCASKLVRIVAMSGRSFLELTRGASLMLNPNVDAISLYPPEVTAILDGRSLGDFTREHLAKDMKVQIAPPSVSTAELNVLLCKLFEREGTVKAAFLAEVRRMDERAEVSLVLTIVVAKAFQERLLQLSALALKTETPDINLPLDIQFLAPDEPRDDLCSGGVQIFGM